MSAVVMLAGAAAFASFPVMLRRPEWAAFLFSFLLVLHANLILSLRFGIGFADPAVLFSMIALIGAYAVLHGDPLRGCTRLVFAYGLWVAAAVNSLVWSQSSGASLDILIAFLPNLAFSCALFLLITDKFRLLYALDGIVAASVLLGGLTILQFALKMQTFDFFGLANGAIGHIADEIDAFRPSGPLLDANYYAQLLLPGFGLAYGAAVGPGTARHRILAAIATTIIGLALLMTSSRGGLVAASVVVLYVLFRYRKLIYVALFVPPVVLALSMLPAYSSRVASFGTSIQVLLTGDGVQDPAIAGRFAEMEAATILFSEHPISGVGYGMFESRYQEISANHDLQLRAADRAAHSLYLESAAEQGSVGLAVLIVVLGMALWALRRAVLAAEGAGETQLAHAMAALGAGSIGLFLSSLFLHDAYAQHLWIVLALLFASERVSLNLQQHQYERAVPNDGRTGQLN